MLDVLARHDRIALQLSGGRDSIACLYLMRPHLANITVYWVNTGAAYPETLSVIAKVRAMCPNFVEIDGAQPGVVAAFGLPSDIVPASHTHIGLAGTGNPGPLIQDRYSCCARVIMSPLAQRMAADGITLVIRGQKAADRLKGPVLSGEVHDGVELLFPIEDWTARQVMAYLAAEGAPIPRFYEMLGGAPDCMTCSAYWEEGAAGYLKRYHHIEYVEVQKRLDVINAAVGQHIIHFNSEVSA